MVFLDNELDPNTGTIHARGLLDNKDRRFTPGMFARVKLIGSREYNAMLINDSAVGTDQSIKFVLKVGEGNKVEYAPVKLGPLVDGLRVVREGLEPDDLDQRFAGHIHRFRKKLKIMSAITMAVIEMTTARVVARPTPSAPPVTEKPVATPITVISNANTTLLDRPS